MADVIISDDRQMVTMQLGGKARRFHAIWLLDNAPSARDAGNGQRLLSFAELPSNDADTAIIDASIVDDTLHLTMGQSNQLVTFSADWLLAHNYDHQPDRDPGWVDDGITLWTNDFSVPEGDFTAIHEDEGALCAWLASVREFGFAKLTGGPIRDGALLDIVDLFGYVRETNYGRLFDVRSEVNPINLAYTGLALQAHTDNPYRDPVPSLQILYCLENSATGGESQVVDGFAAARQLRSADPRAFELLTRYPVRFTYAGAAGVTLTSRKPIIELCSDGELRAVHFNNRSIAPLTDVPYDEMPAFYRAIQAFSARIDAPENQLTFKLAPGESFIVDNQRVMHGRNGYEGEGTRWLQGCYPERDGLYSTLHDLQAKEARA